MNGQHENSNSGDSRTTIQRVESHVWQRLGRGFLVLIPLLITLLIIRYLIATLDSIFSPFIDVFVQRPFIEDIPAISILAWFVLAGVVLGIFYFIGALVAAGSRRQIIDFQNAILSRIPVVKSIYGVARQATDALSTSMGHEFSRVVFLDWPRHGVTAMGLVTGHCHLPDDDRMMLVIYIPTVPNPTSGMLAIVSEDEVTETDITVEEAMKVVFSGGIVLPEIVNSLQNRRRMTRAAAAAAAAASAAASAAAMTETRAIDDS
ncbi:MAG: DUF502 domain-containing protein [Chloroflexi bacterium]|nr:DUF502 domain-containing protein [Chloroflexota bacterium]